jgi:hypothetical protein
VKEFKFPGRLKLPCEVDNSIGSLKLRVQIVPCHINLSPLDTEGVRGRKPPGHANHLGD